MTHHSYLKEINVFLYLEVRMLKTSATLRSTLFVRFDPIYKTFGLVLKPIYTLASIRVKIGALNLIFRLNQDQKCVS